MDSATYSATPVELIFHGKRDPDLAGKVVAAVACVLGDHYGDAYSEPQASTTSRNSVAK